MSEVSVKRGQSLWTIASSLAKQVNPGASDAQIKQLSNEIATANGLGSEAQLRVGQTLMIPETIAGRSGEAIARLSTQPSASAGALQTRLRAQAKPLVDFKAVFSDVTMTSKGVVTLPDVAGSPLHGELHAFRGTSSFMGEAAQMTTSAVFGKLTQGQFDAIHKELGGRSQVAFDPARAYALVDFLPPVVQALVHKDLEIPEPVTLEGTEKIGAEEYYYPRESDHRVGLTVNCHAAAYEALRAYQGAQGEVAIFYADMVRMDDITHDPAKFDVLHDVKADKARELLSLGLKPGDLVQFHQDNGFPRASTNLLHSAVYVGGGLFFEKPNTEGPGKNDPANGVVQDETPFRLATLENMIKPISDAVDGRFRIEVLRTKAPLGDAHNAFGSSYTKDFEAYAEKKGRALGVGLVVEFDQGMGGNIRGEAVSALVRVPLATGTDGVARLG